MVLDSKSGAALAMERLRASRFVPPGDNPLISRSIVILDNFGR